MATAALTLLSQGRVWLSYRPRHCIFITTSLTALLPVAIRCLQVPARVLLRGGHRRHPAAARLPAVAGGRGGGDARGADEAAPERGAGAGPGGPGRLPPQVRAYTCGLTVQHVHTFRVRLQQGVLLVPGPYTTYLAQPRRTQVSHSALSYKQTSFCSGGHVAPTLPRTRKGTPTASLCTP